MSFIQGLYLVPLFIVVVAVVIASAAVMLLLFWLYDLKLHQGLLHS